MTSGDEFDLADAVLNGPPAAATAEQCRAADALNVALAKAIPPQEPPPEIRARLLADVANIGLYFQHSADAVWEPTGMPGLSRRLLYVDRRNRRVTLLLRLAPGGRLPAHPHPGVEEVYLLEGELQMEGGRVLKAGDYQRSEAGSTHVEQWSEGGCTALMIMPLGAQRN